MKKTLKRKIALCLAIAMIFQNSHLVLAEESVEFIKRSFNDTVSSAATITTGSIETKNTFLVDDSAELKPMAADTAYFGYAVEGGNIWYDSNSGIINSCDKTVISANIPEQIDDIKITGINSSAFKDCTNLETISIPVTVSNIGREAFKNCTNLKEIKFNDNDLIDSKLYIAAYAFSGCSSLTKLILPDRLCSIGHGFIMGTGINSIIIPKNVIKTTHYDYTGPFTGCKQLTNVIFADGTTQIPSMILMNSNIADITIPNGVTTIGDYAFAYCPNLENVSIPNTVDTIGNYVFDGCSNLRELVLPQYLYSLGRCFISGTNISCITIPNSIKKINSYRDSGNRIGPFSGCTSLKSVTFEDGITTIPVTFLSQNSSVTEVNIPESVKSISTEAFYCCSSLKQIKLPKNLSSIGENAFYCSGIENINIPATVEQIGSKSFYGCKSLSEVIFNKNSDTNFKLAIGSYAFEECSNLKELILPEQLKSIGYGFIIGTNISSITIPKGVEKSGTHKERGAFAGCSALKSVTFEEGTTSIHNNILSGFGSELTEINIPNSVIKIGDSSFSHNYKLKQINLPNQLTAIGNQAFYYCDGLESITIPDSVISIGDYAFGGCDNLEKIELSENLTSIGDYAFNNCSKLTIYCVANSYAEKYAIENNIPYSSTLLPIGSSYSVNQEEKANYKSNEDPEQTLKVYVDEWERSVQAYKSDVVKVAEKAKSNSVTDNNEDLYKAITEDLETTISLNVLLDENEKEAVLRAIYETVIKNYYNEGVDLGKIKLSGNIFGTIKVEADVINEISKNIDNDNFTYNYGEYTVNVSLFGFMGADFGQVTVKQKNRPISQKISGFTISQDKIAKIVEKYANELKKLEKNATDEAINSLIDEFSSTLGIDNFIKSSVIKKLNKIKPELASKDLGELVDLAEEIGNVYEQGKKITKNGASSTDIYNAAKAISEFSPESSVSVSSKLATTAYKNMVKARKKLVSASTAYLYNNPMPEENESWFDKTLKYFGIKCPVDVYVYDENNNEIASIVDGIVYGDSEIVALNVDGDLKEIYLLQDTPINIKYVATDYGTLNVTVEDYMDNKPIGRMNYYDIPLNIGDTLTSDNANAAAKEIEIKTPSGDSGISEYINANDDAGITVTAKAENGTTSGTAKYVRGDHVSLLATADEGFKFVGWYNDDVFVERDALYEFVAKEDVTLSAKFIMIPSNYIYGDVDCDNNITASDAAFILQKTLVSTFELPIEKKTDDWLEYVDVDDDTYVTASDAAFILQKTLVSTFELPAEKK